MNELHILGALPPEPFLDHLQGPEKEESAQAGGNREPMSAFLSFELPSAPCKKRKEREPATEGGKSLESDQKMESIAKKQLSLQQEAALDAGTEVKADKTSKKRKIEKENSNNLALIPFRTAEERKNDLTAELQDHHEQIESLLQEENPDEETLEEVKKLCLRVVQKVAFLLSLKLDEKVFRCELIQRLRRSDRILKQKGLSFFDREIRIFFPCFYEKGDGTIEYAQCGLNLLKTCLRAPRLLDSSLIYFNRHTFDRGIFLFCLDESLEKKAPLYVKALVFLIEKKSDKLSQLIPELGLRSFYRLCDQFRIPHLKAEFAKEFLKKRLPEESSKERGEGSQEERALSQKKAERLLQLLGKVHIENAEKELLEVAEQLVLLAYPHSIENLNDSESSYRETRDLRGYLYGVRSLYEAKAPKVFEALRQLGRFMFEKPGFAADSFLRLPCFYREENGQEAAFNFSLILPQVLLYSAFFKRQLRRLSKEELLQKQSFGFRGRSTRQLAQSHSFLFRIENTLRRKELIEKGEGLLFFLSPEESAGLRSLQAREFELLQILLWELHRLDGNLNPPSEDSSLLDGCAIEDLCSLYELSQEYECPGLAIKIFKQFAQRNSCSWESVTKLLETIFSYPNRDLDALALLSECSEVTGFQIKLCRNFHLKALNLLETSKSSRPLETFLFLQEKNRLSLVTRFLEKAEELNLGIFSSLPVESQRFFLKKIEENSCLKRLSISPSELLAEAALPLNLKQLLWRINSPRESRVYDKVVYGTWSFAVEDSSSVLRSSDALSRPSSPELLKIFKFLGVPASACSIIYDKSFFQALIRDEDICLEWMQGENLSSLEFSLLSRADSFITPIKIKHLIIADYDSNWLDLLPYYIDLANLESFSVYKNEEPFSKERFFYLRSMMTNLKKIFKDF